MQNLKEIVSGVFNIDINKVDEDLSRDTLENWDSFNHLLLISEIEKKLGIKFTITEIERIKSFRELKQIISDKKKQDK